MGSYRLASTLRLIVVWEPPLLEQVESLTIRPERPLVVMSMTRPRRSFGLPCKLVDRDAYDWLTDDYMAKVMAGRGGVSSTVTGRDDDSLARVRTEHPWPCVEKPPAPRHRGGHHLDIPTALGLARVWSVPLA